MANDRGDHGYAYPERICQAHMFSNPIRRVTAASIIVSDAAGAFPVLHQSPLFETATVS